MIYLDNAATTKPDAECFDKAKKYINEAFYNPSALYAEGYNLHKELNASRAKLLNYIANDREYDLIFTSCGTEADNQAIFSGGKRGNVVTTLGEHSAIFSSVNALKEKGIDVRFAELNGDGSVNTDSLVNIIDENTSLVSVIHVNNETGAINDVNAIVKLVKCINKRTLFHSDGVQAFGKIPYKLSKDIDLYSISSHKIGALKGVGALIKRKSLIIKPYIYGGGQENGLRSGTENVFGIKFMEYAAEKRYGNLVENYDKIKSLNSLMRELLDKSLFEIISSEEASPYILTIGARGVRGETILHEVNDKGLIIGTGSACSSNEKRRYSRVILACGIGEDVAVGILRLSFGVDNTEEEIRKAAEILNKTVKNRLEIMA